MSFIKKLFGRRKDSDSSERENASSASSNASSSEANPKKLEQQNYWDTGIAGDPNSTDLFVQAKAYDIGSGVEVDKSRAATLYREAMNNGDKRAKHNLAVMYITQEGELKDPSMGVQMLQELAEEGEAASIYTLAGCYMTGNGVSQDTQKGLELYQKASEMGMGEATYSIGAYYINECQDMEKGIAYCEKAAEQGFALAASILAQIHEEGMGVEKDIEKAMVYFKRAAELGDAHCQLKYGLYLYVQGNKEGARWMIKSANQKYPAALMFTGRECLNKGSFLFEEPDHFRMGVGMLREAAKMGIEDASKILAHYGLEREQDNNKRIASFYNALVSADEETAQKAFQQMYECSEIGDPIAQNIMGLGYYYGWFGKQDEEKAFELLKRACDAGCVDALNSMGLILNQKEKYEEAFPYHKQSAEQGDMYGLHNLGNAYFYARGVERDVVKAITLWHEAAEKGNIDSIYTIGNMFFHGDYYEKDIQKAIECFTLVAKEECSSQILAMKQLVKAFRLLGEEEKANEWEMKLKEKNQ